MRNIRVLLLRLVVDSILALAGFGIACGICFMFFGAVEGFKLWFAFAFIALFVAIAMDDVRDFVNAQSKRR
jgi:hypothetical protein